MMFSDETKSILGEPGGVVIHGNGLILLKRQQQRGGIMFLASAVSTVVTSKLIV